jgi:hypothetical protein
MQYQYDDDFVQSIETNTSTYLKIFAEAADDCMPEPTRTDIPDDVYDVLLKQVGSCAACSPNTSGCACETPCELTHELSVSLAETRHERAAARDDDGRADGMQSSHGILRPNLTCVWSTAPLSFPTLGVGHQAPEPTIPGLSSQHSCS